MCANSLHGVIAANHVGNDRVVVVGIEPAAVADLAAGLGVERRVIQDDLAFVAGFQFAGALSCSE